jgi:UDP-glucose 4-epimerase
MDRYVVLRYFNAAGAELDGTIGECHDPETHVIPLAIRGAFTIDTLKSLALQLSGGELTSLQPGPSKPRLR